MLVSQKWVDDEKQDLQGSFRRQRIGHARKAQ